jgi:hypothetical protein
MITLKSIIQFEPQLIATVYPINTDFYTKVYYDDGGNITTMNTEFGEDPADKLSTELGEILHEKIMTLLGNLVTDRVAFTAPAVHIRGRVNCDDESGSYSLTEVVVENYGKEPFKVTV